MMSKAVSLFISCGASKSIEKGIRKMKTFEEKSRKYYNRIADSYDRSFDSLVTNKFKHFLLQDIVIHSNDAVLDVACGNGTLLKLLSERWKIRGYGLDIAEKMIENAKRKCPDMTFEVSSCEHSSLPGQSIDVIIVCAAYHHFPDVRAFAQEANRLLKPYGQLYIAEMYFPFFRVLINPLLRHWKAGDVKYYSPKEIRANFESFGFEQIGFRKRGFMQIVKMRKK